MAQFTGLNASEANAARRAVADMATRYEGYGKSQMSPVTSALGGAWSDFANAWCSAFTNLMYSTAGVDNDQRDKLMAKSWLKVGTPVPADQAQKGDVVVFNRKDPKSVYGHVGIITGVNKDGTIETVEGNTGGGAGKVRVGDRDIERGIGWGTAGVVRPDVPGYSAYGAELSTPSEIGAFQRQMGSLDTLAEGATAPAWNGVSDSDFSAPAPGAVERGADLPAPAPNYNPLSSVSVPAQQPAAKSYDPLSSVQAPMGTPQTFGSFTPSFTDKSTFTAPPATRPAQPQSTLGVTPGFEKSPTAGMDVQSAPLAPVAPPAPAEQDREAARAAALSSLPQAPQAPLPAPNVNVPMPAEVPAAPDVLAKQVPEALPPPVTVSAPPKVAAVSAPQRAPRVAPSRPQPSVGPQTQAMDQPQDPVQSFSQQVGTPQNFMSMNPKDFGMAVGAMAALSPNAQKINALAAQVSDPKVGIVAQNALQNEYAGLTGQPQTKSLWGGLWGDLSKAFGSSPEIGFNNSPDSKQGMYVQGVDGPVWGAFSDLQKQINAGTAGGLGSGGFGPGTSGLW